MSITLKTQQLFETTDGKTWMNEVDARAHQAHLDHGLLMEQYVRENPALFEKQGAVGRFLNQMAPFIGWLMIKGAVLPAPDPVPEPDQDPVPENAE